MQVNSLLCAAIVLIFKVFFRADKVFLSYHPKCWWMIGHYHLANISDSCWSQSNYYRADILFINTFPQQLNFSDNWKQQRLFFPLNPRSNLCFPVPRHGNRPPPRISCTKQLYCTNMKQKYLSLQENGADPRHRQSRQMPWAGQCWGGWAGYGSLFTIAISEPWKISLLCCCHPGEAERWRPLLGAATPVKASNPVLCHCHHSCPN